MSNRLGGIEMKTPPGPTIVVWPPDPLDVAVVLLLPGRAPAIPPTAICPLNCMFPDEGGGYWPGIGVGAPSEPINVSNETMKIKNCPTFGY
jgi:hypothetical protein